MQFPFPPTIFKSNPYQEEWYSTDFMHSPDGIKNFPRHHCKITFMISLPFIKKFKNAIDVGCRDGEYSRYLQHHFEHTYGFDPRLRPNYPYNVDLKKVTHFNCALGDRQESITMFGGTHDPTHGTQSAVVPCFRLDDFGLTDISYIKIDVEGFEEKVLAGGQELIERDRPIVVVEQNEVGLEGSDKFGAKTWLEARGYRHAATCPRGWDYIMVPV